MDLSTCQLHTFLVVARELNFTRAAEELNLTQPAVTAQIQKLQRAVGAPLFGQVGRRVELTPAGILLCRYAERILATVDELQGALACSSDQSEGVLGIGAGPTAGLSILPLLLPRFVAHHPRVTPRVHLGRAPEVVRKVAEGSLDVALVGWDFTDSRVESITFLEDDLIVIVPPRHRWAGGQAVDLRELATEPFISREPGSTTRALVAEEVGRAGVTLDVVAEMNDNEAVVRAVRLGLGFSIVSGISAAGDLAAGSLCRVEVRGLAMRPRRFNLVLRRGKARRPAVLGFQQLVLELLPQLGTQPRRREEHEGAQRL